MLNDFYTKLNLLSGGKFNKLRIAILAFFCVVASSQIFPQSVNIHFQSAKIHISTHHSNTFPQKNVFAAWQLLAAAGGAAAEEIESIDVNLGHVMLYACAIFPHASSQFPLNI